MIPTQATGLKGFWYLDFFLKGADPAHGSDNSAASKAFVKKGRYLVMAANNMKS